MMVVRWLIGGALLLLFAYIATIQAVYVIRFLLKKTTKHSSLVPAFIFGVMGLLVVPYPSALQWWWVPLVLDVFVSMLIFGKFLSHET